VVWTAARVREWQRTGLRPPVAVWLPAQTAWFLNSIRSDRLYAAYHLIALRGLRRGEAAGLRWCDVDLDDATAMIGQQLQQYSGHLSVCPPKTARSQRAVALDRTTVTVLRRHRDNQESERTALGDRYHDSGYVFTGIKGDPMAPDRLSRHFRQLSAEAGLPPVRLHDLRHGAASLAIAAGAELKTIQDQLGHSSIALTADTYISVLPEVARKAAENTATLVIKAGYLVPGTRRPRHPTFRSVRQRPRAAITSGASLAHPARQIGHPARTNPPRPGGPAARRHDPYSQRDPAIPWPAPAHTRTAAGTS
jgi:integrase